MGHPFCHIELCTTNPEAAKSFYKGLFDWTFPDMPGGYHVFQTGSPPAGGIMQIPDPSVPVAWTAYIAVDDVEEAVRKAQDLGGRTLKGRTEVPGMGFFAVLADPQGGVFGVWQHQPAS